MVLAVIIAAFVGCGDGGSGTAASPPPWRGQVGVALDGRVGPANIGFHMAKERGIFENFDLRPVLASPAYPTEMAKYFTTGLDEFGVMQLPQILMAKEQGAPIIAVASLLPHPTAAMIWLKSSKIDGIADLKGKTISIPGSPFQKALLKAVLKRAGLALHDVDIKPVEYKLVSALLGGRTDAIFGGSWNIEGAALKARGAEPVINRVRDLGVPAYDELVVVARSDVVAEDPRLVRDFLTALTDGVAAERKDPETAVKLIEESFESSPELNRKETEAAMEATLPLLSADGYLDPRQATTLGRWMHEEGLIRREPSTSEFLTNEYLPSP